MVDENEDRPEEEEKSGPEEGGPPEPEEGGPPEPDQGGPPEPEEEDIVLTERDFETFAKKVFKKPPRIKETAAKNIGLLLLIIFGATIFLILIIFAIFIFKVSATAQIKEYTNALITLLDGISKFSSAVFTPLLAFVLGYYFGTTKIEKSNGRES
jgi:hypothetical protein